MCDVPGFDGFRFVGQVRDDLQELILPLVLKKNLFYFISIISVNFLHCTSAVLIRKTIDNIFHYHKTKIN